MKAEVMEKELEKIIEILNANNQKEVAKQIENLKDLKIDDLDKKVHQLYSSLLNVDFEQLENLYQLTKQDFTSIDESLIKPIEFVDKNKLSSLELSELESLGIENLKNYAVVTMAGGQGTRLGFNGPKGTFELNVFGKKKTIFEILANKIVKINKEYGVNIPWYIMTSQENDKDTKSYFKKKNNFGLNIHFFKQNDIPLLDNDGNVLINSNFEIKRASDGNGGVFASLANAKFISQMKENDIKYVFISGVDNCLAQLVDLSFLGLFAKSKKQIASKSVIKNDPHEKVGVFCIYDGHPKVIEYSELPTQMAEEVNERNELVYSQSNSLCHLFTMEAIDYISKQNLKYHYARKKNSYLNTVFKEVIPSDINSYKFESFIFDSFDFFDDMLVYTINREEEFAPIKNKEGNDSPKTAKVLYENYLKKYGNVE